MPDVTPIGTSPNALQASRGGWMLLVLLLCFGMGLLMRWSVLEHQRIATQQNQNRAMGTAAILASGKADDLGGLLADKRTMLIRLNGSSQGSLAYNDALHRGYLFCANLPILPMRQTYKIVAVGGLRYTVLDFASVPGQSVYAFHVEPGTGVIRRFELVDGSTDHRADRAIAAGDIPSLEAK